jgi:hypothetical protein
MKFQEKTRMDENSDQITIDPKLNDVARKRKPSPKLEEANIILSKLKRNKKNASFFS